MKGMLFQTTNNEFRINSTQTNRIMIQGSTLLSIWPKESNYIYGPAPSAGVHPYHDHPVLGIEMATPPKVIFPPVPQLNSSQIARGDFYSLDLQTQQQLLEICEQDMLFKAPTEVREVILLINTNQLLLITSFIYCRFCGKKDIIYIIFLQLYLKYY